MMKKLLSLLLALMLCLSLAACGGDDSSADDNNNAPPAADTGDAGTSDDAEVPEDLGAGAEEPPEAGGNYCSDYSILADNFELYVVLPIDRLTAAPWSFSGGCNSETEMEQEELENILAVYGGTLQVEFVDEETANLVQGGGILPGTYRVLDDGASINFSFEAQGQSFDYVGVFTAIGDDETPVLLFLSPDAPDTAFYMTAAA